MKKRRVTLGEAYEQVVCRTKQDDRETWDEYFMGLAKKVASRSKDRSNKVGIALVGPDKEVRSTGYNGFPRGVNDDVEERHQRPAKYLFTEHGERNGVYNAARAGICTKGCTMFVHTEPDRLKPCAECARAVIQSGIVRVVYGFVKSTPERWKASCDAASEMFAESGVEVCMMED
jgi:dCMP deaminase